MKIVVGLGNPGSRYEGTRHNIGFEVVGFLTRELGISKKDFPSVQFLLPQTFMNRSGQAVREARDFYKVAEQDLMVVHDDIDLGLGKIKLDFDAGAAGHRGVTSIIDELGTKAFYRIRLGIGRPARKEEVEDYVLSPFRPEELEEVDGMIQKGAEMVKKWILGETQ